MRAVALTLTLFIATACTQAAASTPASAPRPKPTVVTTTTTTTPDPVTPELVAAWSRVATCESGGWVVLGSAYPNSLGITAQNWYQFGGTGDTSMRAQILVAERFRAAYGIGIPDQNGCAPW